MGSHAAPKSHMAAAIIFGLVLVTLVFLIFGALSGNYAVMLPILIAYSAWTIVSLFIFGRGLSREEAAAAHAEH
ncbi:MAG: hypothetical protein B7C55_03640 [Actinomycetales bacterium mxb001]|nr:MAG: hypothetical protein B7C55_03640 [Actinomycetales bacterium mxb001]